MSNPVFRPRTSQEEAPDLARPHFSNCTVPVVFFTYFPHNFGESFERILVLLWVANRKKAWDKRWVRVQTGKNKM